ncbi:peptide deformylase [Streptacidiphilus jiangxiensis]|uniref:Peptide deformylase n=1 Tax=Streptacidiphilus jiangxiensis TaxID=235985 RepID=A0A1H7U6A3_STRJI|nr:peptide deformylase [Streptacidiphilus jiangxiensis]SEL92218.1 peptide deformylase [Streptacidiphilus jiangxiensis]
MLSRIPGSAGVVHPVTPWASSVLRTPCATVESFDAELARLVEDMFATMYAEDGVGLAANQIGVGLRVFVYDCPDDEDERHLGHVVNPVLVEADGVVVAGEEGCLSLPGLRAQTPRPDRAVVRGQDLTGAAIEIEGTGFFARCLLHETAHLDGGVFLDELGGWRRARARRAMRRAEWYVPAVEGRHDA